MASKNNNNNNQNSGRQDVQQNGQVAEVTTAAQAVSILEQSNTEAAKSTLQNVKRAGAVAANTKND